MELLFAFGCGGCCMAILVWIGFMIWMYKMVMSPGSAWS